ncbi:serine protease, partial [Candidatus Peregrinibacteria bacterium]|nr:serine protease [Candidatus Peregrinibacteria bacterium]
GDKVSFGKFWPESDSTYSTAFSSSKDFVVVAFPRDIFKKRPRLSFSSQQIEPSTKMFLPHWVGESNNLRWRMENGNGVLARTAEAETEFYPFSLKLNFAIQKGNSGGPLLDAEGRVIGVASYIADADKNKAEQTYLCLDRINQKDFDELEKIARAQIKKP